MIGRTLGPALAMGNATVLKPAEDACLTPLRIAELAAEVGFPEGAINVVPGLGHEAGAALAGHPDIDFIAFTGSPQVGVLIQTAAAQNHIGCVLELGGKSRKLSLMTLILKHAFLFLWLQSFKMPVRPVLPAPVCWYSSPSGTKLSRLLPSVSKLCEPEHQTIILISAPSLMTSSAAR